MTCPTPGDILSEQGDPGRHDDVEAGIVGDRVHEVEQLFRRRGKVGVQVCDNIRFRFLFQRSQQALADRLRLPGIGWQCEDIDRVAPIAQHCQPYWGRVGGAVVHAQHSDAGSSGQGAYASIIETVGLVEARYNDDRVTPFGLGRHRTWWATAQ